MRLIFNLCGMGTCEEHVIYARVWLGCHFTQVGLMAVPGIILGRDGLETLWICLLHFTNCQRFMISIDHTYANFLTMWLSIEHSIPSITFLFFSYRPYPYVTIILLRLEGLLLWLTL